ncbi:EcsC family protein [Thalassovita sp.]|uniref:EcsC family protein n=1 Tax=Thalassovita sp. TaxID=1979401 RepID=UPI003B58E8D8
MTQIFVSDPAQPVDLEAELEQLAQRYQSAGGMGVQLLNMIGGQADSLLNRLPAPVRSRLEEGTVKALNVAMKAAHGSRGVVGQQPPWLNTAVATAMGAAGGFGGLPGALAELPVTTTVLLRSIQDVAVDHGFDPAAENVQFDCIRVLSAAGPLDEDDGADLAFFATRASLQGVAVQTMIARVAPRLATVLGQKLAAQTAPVLGAVAGAATNYAYTSYYQQIAHVHFRIRALGVETDHPEEELREALRQRVSLPGPLS